MKKFFKSLAFKVVVSVSVLGGAYGTYTVVSKKPSEPVKVEAGVVKDGDTTKLGMPKSKSDTDSVTVKLTK